jgi:SAM-dependent methyltransferase
MTIRIFDTAYDYLVTQQGSLDPLKDDRAKWAVAYEEMLRDKFDSFKLYIPVPCRNVLDVGSGMGGINILVHEYTKADIYLLDGIKDQPIVKRNWQTHNSMQVAQKFLAVNGVALAGWFSPALRLHAAKKVRPKFDLVISLGAWCFHLPPRQYLAFVAEHMGPSGRMVVEVRIDREDYDAELKEKFNLVDVIHKARKYERRVYERA